MLSHVPGGIIVRDNDFISYNNELVFELFKIYSPAYIEKNLELI